jgi:Putative Actinobacterial Holin-X, holin superfamily III
MADQAVGDIIKNITDEVKLLVRDEMELAKQELVPAARNAGIGAGLFGVAGYFAISGLFILYFAAAYGLVAAGLSAWLSFLIVGVALFVLAGLCGLVGLLAVKRVKPPNRAINQANQTVAEVKAAAQHAMAAAKAPQIEGTVVERRAIR